MTADRPQWEDPFSPEGIRQATSKILTGTNYRLFYEGVTRRKLIKTYRELAELARQHPHDDEEWKQSVRAMLREGTPEERNLRHWLVGLTKKTADNNGVKIEDYPSFFDEIIADIEDYPSDIKTRDTALLLWAGAATLTIRGSQKAKIGIALEKSLARAALTIIGLSEEDEQFRLDIEADEEVPRQTDAEIRTPRGFRRMEIGLISKRNSEVIGDKVGRLERNDVVLFDTLSAKSAMWTTAEQKGVKLIQLRNNNPAEELRRHLSNLNVPVQPASISPDEVEKRVMEMPLQAFAN